MTEEIKPIELEDDELESVSGGSTVVYNGCRYEANNPDIYHDKCPHCGVPAEGNLFYASIDTGKPWKTRVYKCEACSWFWD